MGSGGSCKVLLTAELERGMARLLSRSGFATLGTSHTPTPIESMSDKAAFCLMPSNLTPLASPRYSFEA